MRIAITGGTGFVGGHIARELLNRGHEVVLISRRHHDANPANPRSTTYPIGLDDNGALAKALEGCDAVAHCAGINREIGRQTYQRVHIDGTRNVVAAARQCGVRKLLLISFLRARPGCGSPYHESKFAAEEIIRASGLDYTIFKPGVIYGRGDHMLDHLSRAFHTFPAFALVGFRDQLIRPLAVADLARIAAAALTDNELSRQTLAILGPEELTLRQAIARVARVVGKKPLAFPMPVWFHQLLARFCEMIMRVPMISRAQVRILSEGLTVPLPPCEEPPPHLRPTTPFSETSIRAGLPEPGPFSLADLTCACCAR